MDTPARRFRPWVLAGAVVLAGAAGWAGWHFFVRRPADPPPTTPVVEADPSPPPDPRLTFDTEFRNVRPGVAYLGDAACVKCHAEVCGTYQKHPMGRSAALVGQAGPLEKYDAAGKNPFTTKAHEVSVLDGGKRHSVRGTDPATADVPAYQPTVDVVIGSGTRGRSYLTLDRGAAWQSPVSWFTDDARWNVSPSFDLSDGGRRAVSAECLYCHVNRTEPVKGAENLYTRLLVGQAHIGCERCHGPGELHAKKHTDGAKTTGRDDSIVNPRHLPQQLQLDVCRQCHLLGEQRVTRRGRDLAEFRPGLPLDLFLSVYVRHPDLADGKRSVGQFEQMEKSGCFTKSKGALACTSCHDPHAVPAAADEPAFYRGKCMTCHEKQGCSQPAAVRQANGNDCVACHMPKRGSTSVAHAAVTDHAIPRRRDARPTARPPAVALPGLMPIVPYRVGEHAPGADERDRDLGVALAVQLGGSPGGDPVQMQSMAREAANKLSEAVRRWPTDEVAWVRLSTAYGVLGERAKCLEAARKAAELQPGSERTLAALAEAELVAGEMGTAIGVWERLIKLNPSAVSYRLLRASALRVRGEWAKAEEAYREAIAINPMVAEAHLYRAVVLHKLGKPDEAKKAADAAFALETNPEVVKEYRRAYPPR